MYYARLVPYELEPPIYGRSPEFLGSMLRRIKNAAAHKKLVDIETQARIFPVLLRCSIKILVALKRDRYKLGRRGRRVG